MLQCAAAGVANHPAKELDRSAGQKTPALHTVLDQTCFTPLNPFFENRSSKSIIIMKKCQGNCVEIEHHHHHLSTRTLDKKQPFCSKIDRL
jgi:hypothetical protein